MGVASANFAFLEQYDPQLVRLAGLAQRYFPDDPNGRSVKLRMFCELPRLSGQRFWTRCTVLILVVFERLAT